jgi:hypothetical protein
VVHDKGIVHRDLKPENLFIQPGDRVKIGDFGIARDSDMSSLTTIGRPMGTPLYMAPERWDSLPATVATDLYALGCVLYEMLTGGPPFTGNLTVVMTQHMTVVPASPRELNADVPGRLNDLVMALIAKDPARRPPSAGVVSSALRRTLRDHLSTPVPPSDPPRAPAPRPAPRLPARLGCVWAPRGGFEIFARTGQAGLHRARLLPAGDWEAWQRVRLPDGQVSAIAVGAARAVTDWDKSTYGLYRGLAAAVGGTVFHSLEADGGWSVWEALPPLPGAVVDLAFAAHSTPGLWGVFALDATGLVHHRVLAGGVDWATIPGPVGRPVTAIAAGYGQVPELVAVAGGDVWRTRQFRSGRWQDWDVVSRPARPAVDVALSPLGGDGELFVLDRTGQVHHASLPPGPGAGPMIEVPPLRPAQGTIVAITASLMLVQGGYRGHVLCALTADGALHHTAGRPAAASATSPATWSRWQPVPPAG